jgi:hypothetical protein
MKQVYQYYSNILFSILWTVLFLVICYKHFFQGIDPSTFHVFLILSIQLSQYNNSRNQSKT